MDKTIPVLICILLISIIVHLYQIEYSKDQYIYGYEKGSWDTANYNKYTDKYPCFEWRHTFLYTNLQNEEDFRSTFSVCGIDDTIYVINHTILNNKRCKELSGRDLRVDDKSTTMP